MITHTLTHTHTHTPYHYEMLLLLSSSSPSSPSPFKIFMFTIVVVNMITNDANILNHVRVCMIQYHYQAISPDAKYFPLESNATEVTALV